MAHTLQRAADAGVNFIGGFSALVHKAYDRERPESHFLSSFPQALAETELVCSSVNVATTKAGINMDAIRLMGHTVRRCAELTADRSPSAVQKLVVFANVPEDNPFMAGAFHGVGDPETVINVGVSGPGVVSSAIERAGDCDLSALAELIKRTAFKIRGSVSWSPPRRAQRLGVPLRYRGSVPGTNACYRRLSVAQILEDMGLESLRATRHHRGTRYAHDAVKKGGVMASGHVGGLSGAFIPVSEDAGMIAAVERGALSVEKLEAMTAVCSVGWIDSRTGRHGRRMSLGRADRRRNLHRRNQQQNDSRPSHSAAVSQSETRWTLADCWAVRLSCRLRPWSPARFVRRGGRSRRPSTASETEETPEGDS